MALRGIIGCEHSRLLSKIDSLPDERSAPLRDELNEAYAKYHQQLLDLSKTIAAYETVAARVRVRRKLKKVAVSIQASTYFGVKRV